MLSQFECLKIQKILVNNSGKFLLILKRKWTNPPVKNFPLQLLFCRNSFHYRARCLRVMSFAACQSYAFIAGICGFNSIGTMGLIANDRYRFIAHPLEMLHKATGRRAITEIVGVWIWSALCTAPPLFGWGRYIPEGFQVSV